MKKYLFIIVAIIFIHSVKAQLVIPTKYDTLYSSTDSHPVVSYSMIYPKGWIKKENKSYQGRYTITQKNVIGSIFFTPLVTYISLEESYKATLKETEEDPTKKIGLKVLKPTWFVISYQQNTTINYLKKWMMEDGSIFYLEFEYPESERKLFDSIISKMTKYNPGQ